MFDLPLKEPESYWCGYLQADGGIYSRARAQAHWKRSTNIVFAQKECGPVQKFIEFFGAEGKVRHVIQQTNFALQERYQASTSKYAARLQELGIKTDDWHESLRSDPNFWRGMIDGDGSVGWVMNSGKQYPVIALCGSLSDMTHFANYIFSLGLRYPKVGVARSIFRVALNGAPAVKLISVLYPDGCYCANQAKLERAQQCSQWIGRIRR